MFRYLRGSVARVCFILYATDRLYQALKSTSEATVTLSRCGREFSLQLNRSYSATQLGRMFSVEPGSIWLRETYSNRAYFPSDDGTFNLQAEGVEIYTEMTVEGDSVRSTAPPSSTAVTLSATTGSSSSSSSSANSILSSLPNFPSVLTSHGRRRSSGGGCNLKVVQAGITCFCFGRPEFRRLGQTFISLSEATANIHHVS